MNITTTIEIITPEIANIWLQSNNGNRPKSKSHIKQLADIMLAGGWKLNGDAIRFAGDTLIDGQHRLEAVRLSNCTIQSIVVRGIDPSCFDCIDAGKRRSTADTLGCMGFKNTTKLAAMLSMIDRYMTSRLDKVVHYSNAEMEELVNKYPDAPDEIIHDYKAKMRGLVSACVVDSCRYLFAKKDRNAMEQFMDRVLKGANISEGTPEYLLRERLIANSLSKSKLPKEYIMILFIKAWNARRAGIEMKALRHHEGSVIPVII